VRFCRTFRANHEDEPEKIRILKVFTIKHFFEDEEREKERKRIQREFEAIRRLSHTGVVPGSDPPFEADDSNLIIFPYYLPEGESLASIIEKEAPKSPQKVLKIILAIIKSLEIIHKEGILHRNLSPLAIHLFNDDLTRAMFSDFDLSRISGKDSISAIYEEEEFRGSYLAPELKVGLGFGEPTSDIYAIGIILYEMLSGELFWTGIEQDKLDFEKLKETLVEEPEDILMAIEELIKDLTQEDDRERISNIPEIRKRINTILTRYSEVEAEQASQSTCLPWKEGEIVEEQYKVIRKLGRGTISDTFLVHDVLCDQPYVLKCIRDPIHTVPMIQTEFKALDGLEHKGTVKIVDVFPPSKPFHIKYEYVEGPTLEELRDEFPWSLERAARITKEILETLEYLETQGTYHRDISPKNIILDKIHGQARLVDFGFAMTADGISKGVVGTPIYWPPELERGEPWNPTADLYALAIILYEMAAGSMPFLKEDDYYRKNELIPPESKHIPQPIWEIVKKALDPERGKRFGSFAEMLEAFNASLVLRVQPETEGKIIINSWVTQLQQLYRNSRTGNQENRGLDSDFARATYVPTALDEKLLPLILEKKYWVVFLTGNPGDGKTVFLEKIEENLIALGANKKRKNPNGWEYIFDNHTFIANYDASESFEGRSSDDVLGELFNDFEGESIPTGDPNKTVLVAVNDGRLRGYFLFDPKYSWLGKEILRQLQKKKVDEHSPILVADLKWRTLISGAFGYSSSRDNFFEKTLDQFIDSKNWDVCQECRLRNFCPLKFNADSLKSSLEARTRLKAILELSILRGRKQMTIRDLRSVLSYILVNVDRCEHLHEQFKTGKPILNWLSKIYFNAVFNIENEPDEFLFEFLDYDPAAVPAPRLERHLHYNRGVSRQKEIEGLLLLSSARGKGLLEGISFQAIGKKYYPQAKRRFYFESDEDRLSEDESGLPNWKKLLPYRYLDTFLQALSGKLPLEKLRDWIAEGITRSDGLFDPDVTIGKLCLKTDEREDQELIVFRQYPVDQFICEIEQFPNYSWLEAVPRHLLFHPIDSQPVLRVGLDLFELLMRFREGSQPGSQEVESFLIDLAQFKAQMLREQAMELVLLEASRRVHHIAQSHKTIIRMET